MVSGLTDVGLFDRLFAGMLVALNLGILGVILSLFWGLGFRV